MNSARNWACPVTLLATLGLAVPAFAQGVEWLRRDGAGLPSERSVAAMVHDSVRGCEVLFGGNGPPETNDTWELANGRWHVRTPLTRPPARSMHAMAFDAVRGRTVLFGGTGAGNTLLGDTWEWDGVDWTLRTPPNSPPARSGHTMTFDEARGRVVMYGGDTWEWDGVDWVQRATSTALPTRMLAVMCYDAARARTVLFGGVVGFSGLMADTWEWDGNVWTQRSPASAPPGCTGHVMAYDRSRQVVVLYWANQTWQWNGSTWQAVATANLPRVQQWMSMAYDTRLQRCVLFGGLPSGTWDFDGVDWLPRPANGAMPARYGHAAAFDSTRGVTVVFGGSSNFVYFGETWEYDGHEWRLRSTSGPAPQFRASMAFDSLRNVCVLLDRYGLTWEWDGVSWTRILPTVAPPARTDAVMAFDSARGVTVLHGGLTPNSTILSDTWEWDGTTWAQRFSATMAPSGGGTMTYDSSRARCVRFGGSSSGTHIFEWDGTVWIARPVIYRPQSPKGRIAYDSGRGVCVLFGGDVNGSMSEGTWEWDGAAWTRVVSQPEPGMRVEHAVVYDDHRHRFVLVGGRNTTAVAVGDTWERVLPAYAFAAPYGQACGSPPLRAVAATDSRPRLGGTQLVDVLDVPTVAFMSLGVSNVSVGGWTLPLPLDAFGMPGCSLLHSADLLFLPCQPLSPTTARYALALPPLAALSGLALWLQPWSLDPTQNVAGFVAGNGLELRLGLL